MVESLFSLDTVLNVIAVFMSAVIPILIIRKLQQSDKKKEIDEQKIAEEVKENNEKIAMALKLASEKVALDLKVDNEKSTKQILDEIAKINIKTAENATNIKILFDGVETSRKKLEDMNKEQSTIVLALGNRAELTNGNIENIRNDIMDLQDSVDDIVSNVQNDEQTRNVVNTRRKSRDRKRIQISNDAKKQDSNKYNIGSYGKR